MTLVRTDGDGYKVVSDIGNEYYLYEMVTIGATERKTSDIVAIMYRTENAENDKLVNYFYGASIYADNFPLNLIREFIQQFESENFSDHPLREGDVVATF